MEQADKSLIAEYLSCVLHTPVQVLSIEQLEGGKSKDLKSFGYGKPYLIRCKAGDDTLEMILESMSENTFGHDHFSDRAQNLLWYHSAANHLPRHARSLDVGAFTKERQMISLGKANEFFILNEFVPGYDYAVDLQRIHTTGSLDRLDERKAETLALYLAEIHSLKQDHPSLYVRRIRDLLGHGECIMGLIDNYPHDDPVATEEVLQQVELACLKWRWKLKRMTHRLSQVHGDFHPWNIIFRKETDFTVLDRSRGEWGEPADDVSSLLINYIFFALQKEGRLKGGFENLSSIFWETYLTQSKDTEIVKLIQPFLAWRALVVCNPIWYPSLSGDIRKKIFQLIHNVLASDLFDLKNVNQYLGVG
jgi:hypothetical protein